MTDSHELSTAEYTRYSRHIILPEVGLEGQQRLKRSSALVVGAGGLGSPVILYLAAAGVGRIGIVDFDAVDVSNLQRQIVHSEASVGTSKLRSAEHRVHELNPFIQLDLYEEKLVADNARRIFEPYEVIIDGTDNFTTRYLVNDACVLMSKPNVYGSIYRFEGQASVFSAADGPCYRCLFPEPPPPEAVPNCAEGGVLGVLAGVIGTIQATEALKLLLGIGSSLAGRLLLYDALEMRFDTLIVRRSDDCPVCGKNAVIKTLQESAVSCASLFPQEASGAAREITPEDLHHRLMGEEPLLLLDVRNPEEYELCHLNGSTLIPLRELADRLGELDPARETVVYCKSGRRSKKAAELLSAHGFTNVRNLTGGILAWAARIDSSMPAY
ncbi:MAG TPA: molybdopterin-synthase adenylyltransferase MoeB [Candidatus Obscuribacterales bacterium]